MKWTIDHKENLSEAWNFRNGAVMRRVVCTATLTRNKKAVCGVLFQTNVQYILGQSGRSRYTLSMLEKQPSKHKSIIHDRCEGVSVFARVFSFFFFLLFFHPIYDIIFALLFSLPPSRNSDPGSHSMLFSPLATTVRALHFLSPENFGSSLVDSRHSL